jgi:xanthosine utilization system XapX-like protein
MIGTGRSVDMTETHEEQARKNLMFYLAEAANRYRDGERRRLAVRLASAKDIGEYFDSVYEKVHGTWRSNVSLGLSALAGLSLGTILSRLTAKFPRLGPVPAVALLGLAGVVPGFLLNESLVVRNTIGIGGLMFSAGAVLNNLIGA